MRPPVREALVIKTTGGFRDGGIISNSLVGRNIEWGSLDIQEMLARAQPPKCPRPTAKMPAPKGQNCPRPRAKIARAHGLAPGETGARQHAPVCTPACTRPPARANAPSPAHERTRKCDRARGRARARTGSRPRIVGSPIRRRPTQVAVYKLRPFISQPSFLHCVFHVLGLLVSSLHETMSLERHLHFVGRM
jgi:hypothetical protein